jgi:hypothetical protein
MLLVALDVSRSLAMYVPWDLEQNLSEVRRRAPIDSIVGPKEYAICMKTRY